jgi:hypothetical protein
MADNAKIGNVTVTEVEKNEDGTIANVSFVDGNGDDRDVAGADVVGEVEEGDTEITLTMDAINQLELGHEIVEDNREQGEATDGTETE